LFRTDGQTTQNYSSEPHNKNNLKKDKEGVKNKIKLRIKSADIIGYTKNRAD